MKTPPEELAQKIVRRLVAEQLLTNEDAVKLLPKLAQGKMRPEDWRLGVEKATARRTEP
jgi:hypothetical protein